MYKIGIDGGGTKTECILVDAAGEIVGRHLAPGSNPSVVGAEQARGVVLEAIQAVQGQIPVSGAASIAATHLYMAGNRAYWREVGAGLRDFGVVTVADDSLPVLELATQGQPGLVLHGGTGSFVAARGPDGATHYAGGLGWRFGDAGSGYDLGQRAIARALLELQGWAPPSPITAAVRAGTPLGAQAEGGAISRYFYQHAEANRPIAALAPAVLRLASEGDAIAHQLVVESVSELLALALQVAGKLFPGVALETVSAGLSGPILTQPVVVKALASRSALRLRPVDGTPIEGVRRLVARG